MMMNVQFLERENQTTEETEYVAVVNGQEVAHCTGDPSKYWDWDFSWEIHGIVDYDENVDSRICRSLADAWEFSSRFFLEASYRI